MRHIGIKTAAVLAALAFGNAAIAEELKIGIVGPLSGPVAVYGTEMLAGAQFALETAQKAATLGSLQIKLIPADSTANPAVAAQAAQRMIESDGVIAILGGGTSAETQSMIEVTKDARVPQLSPLAQDSKLTQQNNKWFVRISQTAEVFASNAARWTIEKQKAKNVYILARNDNYGLSLADSFERTAKEKGAMVSGRVAYEPNAKDFKPILAKMAEAKPDFVSILGFYTDTGLIIKQMSELGIKAPVFANTAPAIPQFRDIAGPASDGAYGAIYYQAGSINTPAGKAFVDNWQAKFHREPSQYEGMGYDGMLVMLEALKQAAATGKLTKDALCDALHAIKNFPGGTGPITILANGDVQRPLPFVQLKGGKLDLDFLIQ
ncbi:MAG: ABC transporter substrate-binding protein [Pseudomonadota bacterium]